MNYKQIAKIFCSAQTDAGNDAVLHLSFRSLSILYICMPPQASSHQILAARLVQKCGRLLAPRDQIRGVRERFFAFNISCI